MFELIFIIICIAFVIVAIGIPLAALIGALYRVGVHYVFDTPENEKKQTFLAEKFYGFEGYDDEGSCMGWVLHLVLGGSLTVVLHQEYENISHLTKDLIGGSVFTIVLTCCMMFLMRGGVRVKTSLAKHMVDPNAHKKEDS